MSYPQHTATYLNNLNIAQLNKLQETVLTEFNQHTDFKILSPTGSGKTLSFLLPIVTHLNSSIEGIQSLIVTPTRELALQVDGVLKAMKTGFKSNCVYGGHQVWIEKNDLSVQPTILIGTPGRIVDHLERNRIQLENVTSFVLDEFDKTLELGFEKDINHIVKQLPKNKKQFFISATEAITIPDFITIDHLFEINHLEEKKVENRLNFKKVTIEDRDKLVDLKKLLFEIGHEPTLVFCNHRESVERISTALKKDKILHDTFHGGLDQSTRERTLIKFRNKSCNILITTDLAARGIDISSIQNIVHYHLPVTEDSYTHRNGRTARVNQSGTVFLLLNPVDVLPDYIKSDTLTDYQFLNQFLLSKPTFETLYIGKGKKDKINKGDILGFLSHQTDLNKEDIGRIDVKDYFAYVAITRSKMPHVVKQIQNKKIKNKKAKFEVAK